MARKKKAIIKGSDPEYTSDFTQQLPTNKIASTPDVKPTSAAPKAPKTAIIAPKQAELTPTAKPTPKIAKKPSSEPAPKSVQTDIGDKREIALSAAVKVAQNEKLIALEAKGISAKDAITLAGRRSVEQFVPKPKFVDKTDVERMPMRQGYKSTKRISAVMLDALRETNDPLRLSSDGAMMRGQFEPLFWSCLDAVIEELNSKY